MSLPTGQDTWIRCPGCDEIEDIWRIGKVGVAPKDYGSRKRTRDSTTFRCHFCGITFKSGGATRREVMGFNVSGRDVTGIQGNPP